MDVQQCPYSPNPDLYGIGVRVGLYSQWAATLLATLFNPRSESTFRMANLIIQCAIFLGLCTESGHHYNASGAVATMFLLCGSLSSLTGDGISHLGHATGMMRIIFYMGLFSYSCWFWFGGIDEMKTKTPGCNEIIFFGGAGVDSKPIRALGKAVSVIGLVVSIVMAGLSVYAVKLRFPNGLRSGFAGREKRRPRVEIALLLLSLGLIALSVTAVEYIVHRNHMQVNDITSVGQLIPLLAGAVASVLTCWKIVSGGLLWRKRCWFFFGQHL